jgi:flagellar basal-body rod protein FlgG
MRSLNVAATGMLAQQFNVDVIANNIANLNTTSFRKERAAFTDLIYQNYNRVGSISSTNGTVLPTGTQFGLGVKINGIYRISEQGTLVGTSNELDVAVNGSGFFQVTLPDGSVAYTRDGSFQRDENGQIVTLQGYPVVPGITIPPDAIDISINENGQVSVSQRNGSVTTSTEIGQLELARFVNEAGLEAQGNNFYFATQASGDAQTGFGGDVGFGTVRQKFLEASNVDAVNEVTSLITAQRSYEINSKVISTSDEMLQTINQIT